MKLFVLCALFVPLVWCASQDWRVQNENLLYKNEIFHTKGVSFFGMETCDYAPHGLWAHSLVYYYDFLQLHEFNMVRIPLSEDLLIHNFETKRPNPNVMQGDVSLKDKYSWQILDEMVNQAYLHNMFVMLDLHRLPCDAQSHELWYDNIYTNDTFFKAWDTLINRYQDHPSFAGIDLLNEPRGKACWCDDHSFSWNLFVESAFDRLSQYKGIYYIEGINWGKDFTGMKKYRIRIPNDRIVYAVHNYGPSVIPDVIMDKEFLTTEWEEKFGWIAREKKCMVLTEWGGKYVGSDKIWLDWFIEWMMTTDIHGIWWSLNPNSGDTGGLLKDDWITPEYEKLDLIYLHEKKPTIIKFF